MENSNEKTNPAEIGEFIARVYRWDAQKITAAFLAALTEANYHAMRSDIEPIIKKHLESN